MNNKKSSRSKAAVFCPVDAKGKITRVCRNVNDLEGFALWMNAGGGTADLRGKSYAKVGGGSASPEAKGEFVDLCCGDFMRPWLKTANEKAYGELLDKDLSGVREAELRRARSILFSLLCALKTDLFGSALDKADMSQKAISALMADLKSDQKMFSSICGVLAQEKADSMKDDFFAFIRSPQCRTLIKSGPSVGSAGGMNEALGYYAPLVAYMAEKLGPSQRAEFMGRFAAYVESGWAVKDRSAENKEAKALRQCIIDIKSGTEPKTLDVEKAINERFNQLFLKVKIKQEGGERGELSCYRAFREEGVPFEEERVMGSGLVDALIVSPDKKEVLAYFVTSDQSLSTQKDEWARHLSGLQNSMEDSRFLASIGAQKGAKLSARAMMPAALGEKRVGEAIDELFKDALSEEDKEVMNLAMFLGKFIANQGNPEQLPDLLPLFAGGSSEVWEDEMRACSLKKGAAEKKAAALSALCRFCGGLMERFEKMELDKKLKARDSAAGMMGSVFIEETMNLMYEVSKLAQTDAKAQKEFLRGKKGLNKFCQNIMDKNISRQTSGIEAEAESVLARLARWENKKESAAKKPTGARSH